MPRPRAGSPSRCPSCTPIFWAACTRRLAERGRASPPPRSGWPGEFGSVTAAAVGAGQLRGRALVAGAPWGCPPEQDWRSSGIPTAAPSRIGTELKNFPASIGPGQMRRRLDQLIETNQRLRAPVRLGRFRCSGPGDAPGDVAGGQETVLAIVGAALRDSIRIVDEAFRLEEDALCVLAPNLGTVEGVQMAERLLGQLDELERAGGLRISDLGRRRRLPRARRRRRRAAAQGRRGDVASPGGRPAGGRRRLFARSLTVSAKSADNWCKPVKRWENGPGVERPRTATFEP